MSKEVKEALGKLFYDRITTLNDIFRCDESWTTVSHNSWQSLCKLKRCLDEGYTYEDFVKYGEMFMKVEFKPEFQQKLLDRHHE
jgi:hypothetical protein